MRVLHPLLFLAQLLAWRVQAAVADEEPSVMNLEQFINLAYRGDIKSTDLWITNVGSNHDDYKEEFYFLVTDRSDPTNELCNTGCRTGVQCDYFHAAVGIIGYFRPGTVKRFCLWEDGWIDSFMSRKTVRVATVGAAPSLKSLVALIDEKGPEETCVPPAYRGILYETMELLCFAMGHKPAVIRQRQIHGTHHNNLNLLSGVPGNLFVPHTRVMITWLLSLKDDVWRGVSRTQWDPDPPMHDPPFEHALVMARDAHLGQHLVDLNVQDASVPHQENDVATANYIAHVGAALGYSQKEVRFYLETAGIINLDYLSEEERKEIHDNAMELGYETFGFDCSNGDGQECRQTQQYPEIPSFRAFLESEEATHLSTKTFHQAVEPIDVVFLL